MKKKFILIVLFSYCYLSNSQTVSDTSLIFGTVDLSKVANSDRIILKNTFIPKEAKLLLIQDYNKLYKKITIKVWYSRLINGKYKFLNEIEVNLTKGSELIELNYINPGVYRVEMWNNNKIRKAIAFIINKDGTL